MKLFRVLVPFIIAAAACGGGRPDDMTPDAEVPPFMPSEVTTLTMGEHGPNGIVADETTVWFAATGDDKHSIRKIDLESLQVTTLVPDIDKAGQLVADADTLYYALSYADGKPKKVMAASKRDGTTRVVFEADDF